jgi:hypothetical protein
VANSYRDYSLKNPTLVAYSLRPWYRWSVDFLQEIVGQDRNMQDFPCNADDWRYISRVKAHLKA